MDSKDIKIILVLFLLTIFFLSCELKKESSKGIPLDNRMVKIPAGYFEMGDHFKEGSKIEPPISKEFVDTFYISIYEISNNEFDTFIKSTEYKTEAERGEAKIDKDNEGKNWKSFFKGQEWAYYPVIMVTYNDALEYCKWLSEKEGDIYRLPTEIEWEKSARGGLTGKRYPWGDSEPTKQSGNFADKSTPYNSILDPNRKINDGFKFLAPVSHYSPNGFGLYNVSGNVSEWCKISINNYTEGDEPIENIAVIRGGSWSLRSSYMRCSFRMFEFKNTASDKIGFRIVKEKTSGKKSTPN